MPCAKLSHYAFIRAFEPLTAVKPALSWSWTILGVACFCYLHSTNTWYDIWATCIKHETHYALTFLFLRPVCKYSCLRIAHITVVLCFFSEPPKLSVSGNFNQPSRSTSVSWILSRSNCSRYSPECRPGKPSGLTPSLDSCVDSEGEILYITIWYFLTKLSL